MGWETRFKASRHEKPGSTDDARNPADKKWSTAQWNMIEAEHYGGKGLQDPDPAQKLKVDRVLEGQKDNENQCAQFDDERSNFGHDRLFCRADLRPEKWLPKISSK